MFRTVMGFFKRMTFFQLTIVPSTNFPSAPESIRALVSVVFRFEHCEMGMVILFLDIDVTVTPFIHNCSSYFESVSEMVDAVSAPSLSKNPVSLIFSGHCVVILWLIVG